MTSDPTRTLEQLFSAQERSARWKAELERASSKLEQARFMEHMAQLLSRGEPVRQLGWDRQQLAHVFSYLMHGDLKRLNKDLGFVE